MNSSLPASAILMPTVFVIQEHLTLSSALISFLGKGEERMHPSPSQMANAWTQSTGPEEVAILCLGGPSSMAWSPGIFSFWEEKGGKNANHSYTQKCGFPPSSFVHTVWVNCDVSVCWGSTSHCFCVNC